MTIQETVRKDGLRIISCNLPTQTKVPVSISALVGSMYDPVDRQGLFHYFEHMAFKGTKRRSVKDIRDFTNRNLLSSNATTMRNRTEYYGVAVYTKLAQACDIIADIYAHSTFPVAEIEKEKGPVFLEVARNRDDDGYLSDLTLRGILYEKNPLRQAGVGTVDGVKSVTRKDLLREKAKWYVPSNTIALAVGRVSHKKFVQEISRRIPVVNANVKKPVWSSELDTLPRVSREVIERRERSKSTLLMGCKMAENANDRREDAEDFLTTLLVSGWTSRLWNEVREKRGLAYVTDGGVARTIGLGAYFNVYVETKPGQEALVEKLMKEIVFAPITAKDRKIFEATRESTNDAITAGFGENLGAWANLIYYKIVKGEPLSSIKRHFETERRIVNSLTLRDLENLRQELFSPERFATVIVKPAGNGKA